MQAVDEDPVELAKSNHGTRSIQKIIEIVKDKHHLGMLISFLADKIQILSEDINGNHVIQKILQTWKEDDKEFIY